MPLLSPRSTIAIVGAITFAATSLAVSGTAYARRKDATFEIFKKAKLAMEKQKSYRVTIKSTDESGKAQTRTMDVMPVEKKYHMKGGENEMISVPGASYINRKGAWKRLPMDMSKAITSSTSMALSEDAKTTTVKPAGPALWKGTPTTTYTFVNSDPDAKSSGKIWLRTSDGLPIHAESTVADPKTTFIADYDYSAAVTITAPSVK